MLRRTVAALLLAICMTACAAPVTQTTEETTTGQTAAATELKVHFFDAGKADAILLMSANSTVLIDAGEKGFGKTILAYLEEQGIERIDYCILTHFDQDHVGGAAKVIHNTTIGTVLQSNQPKDSEAYEKYVKALKDTGIEPITVQETYTFTLDGVVYSVDPPRQAAYASDSSNNSSLIVTVQNGENRFLFTGDAQTERLAEFIDSNSTRFDVLKIPHHGGDEPLMDALLKSTRPTYAVITSSEDEPESAMVMQALEQEGIRVLLTRTGAVTFQSDGTTVSITA